MGRLSLLGVLIFLIAHPSSSQDRSSQPPTFKINVELITVDATVVDKDGVPVKGLTPDDFIVTLQGQTRPVRLLDYLEFGGDVNETTVAGGATGRATTVHRSRGGRIVVIVFDDLSYRPGPGKTLLTATERMLSSFAADDLIGIVTTSGLGPTVNPTRDRSAVVAALHDRKMIGRYDDSAAEFTDVTQPEALDIQRDFPHQTFVDVINRECGSKDETSVCAGKVRNAVSMYGTMTLRRMAQQLDAYRQVIRALSAAPDAPRVLIALTNGVAFGLDASEYADSLAQVSHAAADTKVQFYALSEVPDMVDFSRGMSAQQLLKEGQFLNAGAQVVANAAGGEAFLVSGTADRFIKRIESETSAFYRLGVEAPSGATGQRYLKTAVHVRRPGLSVRATRESIAGKTAAAAPADIDHELRSRLADGGAAYGVPLIVGTVTRRDPGDASRFEVDVSAAVPASVRGPLTMMYGLVNEGGEIVEAARKQVTQSAQLDYQLAFPIRVGTGHYQLRVAVADASGGIGSIERPLSPALTPIGPYQASELLTAATNPDGSSRLIVLSAIPADTQTLTVSLELYADHWSAGDQPQVRFALLLAGVPEPVATSDGALVASGTTATATGHLPVGHLGRGSYTIRATVLENGVERGIISSTFEAASK